MAMISIHADCLLYDLRSVLSLLKHHNTTLLRASETYQAERLLEELVERIEDATSFIQALRKIADELEEEARMGQVPLQRDRDRRSDPSR